MISLKKLLEQSIYGEPLNSIKDLTDDILNKMVVAAQKEYDNWEQDEEGYAEELGYGGICQNIAESMIHILDMNGIDNTYIANSTCEQHVYIIGAFQEGVYQIDIPYHTYETGGGYTWKKLPDIKFDKTHITLDLIDPDPANITMYIEDI